VKSGGGRGGWVRGRGGTTNGKERRFTKGERGRGEGRREGKRKGGVEGDWVIYREKTGDVEGGGRPGTRGKWRAGGGGIGGKGMGGGGRCSWRRWVEEQSEGGGRERVGGGWGRR